MGQLMDDIIGTANSFTENFSDKGNFDYSVNSLTEVDDLLDELRAQKNPEELALMQIKFILPEKVL